MPRNPGEYVVLASHGLRRAGFGIARGRRVTSKAGEFPITRTLGVAQTDKRPEKRLMLKGAPALTNALRNGATDIPCEATSCFSMLPAH